MIASSVHRAKEAKMINHTHIKTKRLAASAYLIILLAFAQPSSGRVDTTYGSSKNELKMESTKSAASFSTYAPAMSSKIGSHSQLPTYDIIGWPTEGDGHLNMDRQLIKMLTSSKNSSSNRSSTSNDSSDFHRNLANLKKVVQGKKLASNSSSAQTSVKQQRALNNTRHQQSMSSLEDDINTIHVLMAMLMLANRRLVEQREKQQLTTAKPPLNQGNSKKSSLQRHQKSLAGTGNRLELESASHVSKTMAALGLTTGIDANHHHQHHKKHQINGNTTATKPSVFRHLPNRKGSAVSLSNKLSTGESRTHQLDHSLVRPGYPSGDSMLASHHQEANRRHHHHQNPLHNHQPITARDLLQVERPTLQEEHLAPENMFVSRPRHPLLDYLQRQGAQSPAREVGQQTFSTHHPFHHHQELEQEPPSGGVNTAPHPGGGPLSPPMVPPYNSWNLVHPSQRHQQQPQPDLGSQNFGQEPGNGNSEPLVSQDPLQQMLHVAKSQQAAALDYERRRLNHELEIRRQQEEARKQHEARLTTSRPPVTATPAAPVGGQENQSNNNQELGGDGGSPEEPQNGGNQLEEPPTGGQENNQQQESGDEQGSSGNQQEAKEAQRQAEDDPDMKQLQGFAGDDFTDLFPPGILSDAEIKEMRRDQEEQRERQAQEEQREREAEEAKGEEEQQAEVENSNREEQQQLEAPQASGNATSQATQDTSAQGTEHGRNSSRTGLQAGMEQQKATRYLPANLLPAQLMGANDSMRANKTRRSHADELRSMMQLSGPRHSAPRSAYLSERPSTATGGYDEPSTSISLEDYLAVTGNGGSGGGGASMEPAGGAGAAAGATVDEHTAAGGEYIEGGPQEPMEALASSSSVAKLGR